MAPRGRAAGSSKAAAAAKGRSASAAAAKTAQQPSPQRRSTRAKATPAQEEKEEKADEDDEDEAAEGEDEEAEQSAAQQNGRMDEDAQQQVDEAEESREEDEDEAEADQQPTSSRRSTRRSTPSAAPQAKASPAQRGASAQERELLALVDAIGTWKGSSNVTKEAMGKTLKQAATLLADYRASEKSVTPSTVGIPAADKPLLKTIAKAMVQRSVLQNKAEELRLLAACCISDILRVFAPQHPYDDKEIQAIFHCVIDLVPGLARQTSPLFNRYFYLLESLTIVQTPLVLCTLPSQSLMLAFIDALLELCQQGVNTRVAYYIADILTALINELNADEVSAALVDGLLKWLTAEKQVENPTAANIVLRVLDRHKDKLERMVCKWIRDVIIKPAKRGGAAGGEKKNSKKSAKSRADDDEAEEEQDDDPDRIESAITSHADHITIFKILHTEVPGILLSIHSELADLLQCEAWEGVRREFTGVYCDIFIARPGVIRHMPLLYETLLLRFKDVSAAVRTPMTERAGALMIAVYGGGQVSPVIDEDAVMRDEGKADGVTSGVVIDDLPHRELMSLESFQEHLTVSVLDRDEKVRQHTVKSLAAACIHSPTLVNLQLLTLMGKRCLDREAEVRRESLIGLSHVFHRHLTPHWRKGRPPPPANRKLRFIPSTLLTSVKLDANNALMVELAMDSHLIGLKENEVDGVDERTTCLLAIFDTLESESRTEVDPHLAIPLPSQRDEEAAKQLFLNRYVAHKASTQKGVGDCIAIQQQIVTLQQRGEHTTAAKTAQRSRYFALARWLYFEDDAAFFSSAGPNHQAQKDEALRYLHDVLHGIFTHEDPDVIDSLQALCDSRTPLRQIREAYAKLRSVIKQKGVKLPTAKKERDMKSLAPVHIATRLASFCSQAVLPIDCVPYLFQRVASGDKFATAAVDLLVAMADAWPVMLAGSVDELYGLLQQKDDETQTAALHILSLIDFSAANVKHSMLNKLKETLKQLSTTSANPQMVKYAVRAIKAVFTENTGAAGTAKANKLKINTSMDEADREDAADKLLHQLFQHFIDHLSETDARLDAVIVGIGEISEYYPRLFKAHREHIIPFFLKQLFVLQSVDHHPVILHAIECMAAFLHSVARAQVDATRDDVDSEVNRENRSIAISLVGFFLRTLLSKGVLTHGGQSSAPSTPANKQAETKEQLEDGDEADSDDEGMVRAKEEQQRRQNQILLTAGKCLIDLCTHQYFRALLFIPSSDRQRRAYHFAPLAFLAQSTTDDVRLPFIDHVAARLLTSQLPFSFSVILCLAATIEENAEFKARIKQQLESLVGRTRRRAQAAETNKLDKRGELKTEGGGKQPVNPNLPELVLADLIYLLSYHPEFVDPTDALLPADVTRDVLDSVGEVYNYFLHILQHFLDSVTERAEGNYSLLLAICSTIKNSEDVRDPSNTKIYKLADLVQLAVHKRSENKVWKSSINTVVSLPRNLYQPRKDPPKERYLPRGYTLPAHRGERDGAVHAPSTPRAHGTPRKRKAGAGSDVSPSSFGLTSPSTARSGKAASRTPGSGVRKAKKPKADKPAKEVPTPSRQMPSRSAKGAVTTYNDDELAGASEEDDDDEENVIPAHRSARNGVNSTAGKSAAKPTMPLNKPRQQPSDDRREKEEQGREEDGAADGEGEGEAEGDEDEAMGAEQEDDVTAGEPDGGDGEEGEDQADDKGEADEDEEDEYVSPVRGGRAKVASQPAGRGRPAANAGRSGRGGKR